MEQECLLRCDESVNSTAQAHSMFQSSNLLRAVHCIRLRLRYANNVCRR
jgi:hypothetical protein